MHELSVTQHLLDIVLQHAQEEDVSRVADIYLVVGQLASIVDDCVQFYWDIISEDTIAQGAVLHFRRIPAEMRCQQCGQSYLLDDSELACPHCGSAAVQLVTGEEFYIDSIEVEQ
jgi:hydrogenase nickel incorporation protein HypA/HybF